RALGKDTCHGAPHHLRDEVTGARVRDTARIDAAAVAQYRVSLSDLPDFLQEMADVDHCDPLGGESPDQPEQTIDIFALEAARRLVHQEDARVGRQRTADLYHLARGQRQLAHPGVRGELRLGEVLQQGQRSPPGRRRRDPPPARSSRSTPSSATVGPNRLARPRSWSTGPTAAALTAR